MRARLSSRFRLIDDAPRRFALERFDRKPPAEERVRAALLEARAQLRRFQLDAVDRSLAQAGTEATTLPPTGEGRALMAEIALRAAERQAMAGANDAALQEMLRALAVDTMPLDPARHSPTLVELHERARAARQKAPLVRVGITTSPPGARVLEGGQQRGQTPLALELPAGPAVLWLALDGHRPVAHRFEARADSPVAVALEPLDEEERLRPLVEAVRRSAGEARRAAALALAGALGVDALVVIDAGEAETIYERARPDLVQAQPQPHRPWYRRGWVWGVIAGTAAAVAVVAGVAGYYASAVEVQPTCCR
jgi:hypothetical protein